MSVNIRKRNNSYQAIVSFKDSTGLWKTKSKQGFKTKTEAKNWGKDYESKIYQDRKDNINSEDTTLIQAINVYLDYKKTRVKLGTYRNNVNTLKLLEPFYDVKVSKILPIQLTMHFQELTQKTGYDYYNSKRIIRTFFNFCINHLKIIRENPILDIKRKCKDNRIKYITFEMFQEILNAFSGREDKQLYIKIAYFTGMRRSEIVGLRQQDIQDCVITVDKQIQKKEITTLKTKNSYRKIPIPIALYKEIKSYKITDINGFIFQKNVSVDYKLSKYFNTSMHCFRHTYATNLLSKGYNLKIVANLLGDTLDTVIKTYVQTDTQEEERIFNAIINQ